MPEDKKIEPWQRVKPAWATANPRIPANAEAYRKLFEQDIGKYDHTDEQGRDIYRRPDGNTFFNFGKAGPYSWRLQNTKTPGTGDPPTDVPLADVFRRSDAQFAQGNPWRAYGNTEEFDLKDTSVDARLRRAALAERWQQTHDPNPANVDKVADLQYAKQIYSDIKQTLGRVKDSEIGNGARFGAAVLNMNAQDLAENGISPDYVQLIGQLERAKQAGIPVPGTATAGQTAGTPEHPLSQFIASDPITAGILAVGGNVYEYLKSTQNLTRLRTLVPQQLNETRKQLNDVVAGDPDARWSPVHIGYANTAAEEAEKEFSHDQNPLSTDVSKQVEEPKQTPTEMKQAATLVPGASAILGSEPSGNAAADKAKQDAETQARKDAETYGGNWWDYLSGAVRSGYPTQFPPKAQGGEIVKRIEDFNKNISEAGMPEQLPPELKQPSAVQPTGQVGGNAEELAQATKAPPTQFLPVAPIAPRESGAPSPWARYGTTLEGTPGPTVPAQQNQPAVNSSINTRFLNPSENQPEQQPTENTATPRLGLQEHVDNLAPGTRFVWHHDGQEYVKT
jgi:hypothetical protein